MSWMLKEIHEQPAALDRLLARETGNINKIAGRIRAHDPALFVLAARGSSDNAALFAKYLFESHLGIPAELAAPSVVSVYKKKPNLARGVVIGISQSGESPDILETLQAAKDTGAYTVAVTNTAGSPISAVAHDTINLCAGKEKGLAATKTYTTQLLAMMLLSASLADDSAMTARINKLPAAVNVMLSTEAPIAELSQRYRYMDHCVIIGRGYNYSTVKEAALKLMETCYVVAQPFSTADFLHGPIAIAGAGFPTFVCVPKGKMAKPLTTLCRELRGKALETIIVSPLPETLKLATRSIRIPVDVDEMLSPLVNIIPFQFFACHLSAARGLDPDKPRFLRKVTRTL